MAHTALSSLLQRSGGKDAHLCLLISPDEMACTKYKQPPNLRGSCLKIAFQQTYTNPIYSVGIHWDPCRHTLRRIPTDVQQQGSLNTPH